MSDSEKKKDEAMESIDNTEKGFAKTYGFVVYDHFGFFIYLNLHAVGRDA